MPKHQIYLFIYFFFVLDKLNRIEKNGKSDFLPRKIPAATAKPTKQERRKTTTVAPTAAGN